MVLSVASGTDLRVVIQITGGVYHAEVYTFADFMMPVATSTLFSHTYRSGKVGLYDFNGPQKFDNVSVTMPEPATLALTALGIGLLASRRLG